MVQTCNDGTNHVRMQAQNTSVCYTAMDSLHYRLNFDLIKKNEIPGKNLLKVVKLQNFVKKCCNVWKI